jgi:hypothetical protein
MKEETMNTEILVIADESGSMQTLKDDANGGFRNFVDEQKNVDGEARLTLVKFANHVHQVYQGSALGWVPDLDLKPRGNTALYDALGLTLNAQRDRIVKEGWANLVIVMVMTDGQENASTEYTKEGIASLVSMAEANGWKFIWMMSNQDAFTTAKSLGSAAARSMTHAATGQGTYDSYAYASHETQNLRAGKDKQ